MSRNGSGTYTKVGGDAVFDTVISETYFNAQIDDMVTALTGSVAADGQTPVTGNIAMGTNKLTGLGAGSAATDSTNLGTVQAGAYANTLADTGAADAYVITPSPAITAYAAGQRFSFIAANASTGASTVNVSALGTKALEYQSVALTGAEIKATSTIVIEYDGTAFQMISPSNLSAGDVVGPASATDNSLAKFDGTTGKLLKDGAVIGTDVLAPTGDGSGLTGIATASSTDTFTNKTFDANGTGNSLSNVDVADLAVGTDGELITWDASGNPAVVAVGTSGQVLTSGGAGVAPTFATLSAGLTLGTAVATTSGSGPTFSSIPSGVSQITVSIYNVTIVGNGVMYIQIGDSGGLEATGYLGTAANVNRDTLTHETTRYCIGAGWNASDILHGVVTLTLEDAAAFSWSMTAQLAAHNVARFTDSTGSKSLSAELTQLKVYTESTFSTGSINIAYI